MNKQANYINYGAGNLKSIDNAMKSIGWSLHFAKHPKELITDLPIILPGVGNFGYCSKKLKDSGFFEYLKSPALEKQKIIGICVGMQLMFEGSDESPEESGLEFFDGRVCSLLSNGIDRVPSVGWYQVEGLTNNCCKYYFIHSYGNLSSSCCRGFYLKGNQKITSIAVKGNKIGFQFHPEKSAEMGLKLLQSVLENDILELF